MSNKLYKRRYLIILGIEMLMIVIAIFLYRGKETTSVYFSQEDLIYNTGEQGFWIDTASTEKKIVTPEFVLPRGMYTITIRYEGKGYAVLNVNYVDGRLNSNVSGNMQTIYANEKQCDFKVHYSDRPMQVYGRMRGDAGSGDYLLIREITIEESPIAFRNFMFQLVLIFMGANLVVWMLVNCKKWNVDKENKFVIKSLIIVTLFASIPLMVDYLPSSNHDLSFHLMRIEGLKAGLQSGMFPVKIQPNWMNGHGYATSVFYGDIFLYIPAVLRLFGVSIQASYQFYVLLVNVATVLVSYWCFSKMSNKRIGVICSAVYTLNIYRLMNLYTRAAVGEYTAMVFLPLILYGLWRVYSLSEESEEHKKSWIWIVIGCSGVLFSHVITCELVALFVMLTCLIFLRKTFRNKTFIVLLKTVAALLLVNLWFLVPFVDYMLNGTYIVNAPGNWVPFRIDERASFVAQLFTNSYGVTSSSLGHEAGMVNEMPQTLGAVVIILICAWFVLYMGRKETGKQLKKAERICISFLLLSLLLSSCLVPYTVLAELITVLQFPLRSIQYVWRFLVMAALFLTWLTCILLQNEAVAREKRRYIVFAIVGVVFWQSLSMMSDVLNENTPMRVYHEGNLTTYEVSGGEYMPVDYNMEDYVEELSYDESAVAITDWYHEGNEIWIIAENISSDVQQLEVPFLYYKGYVAYEETGNVLDISTGKSGRVSVSLPAGYQGSFSVKFIEPWYWRVCEVISLVTLLVICGVIIRKSYCNYKRENKENQCISSSMEKNY